jgi:hypothetical protein
MTALFAADDERLLRIASDNDIESDGFLQVTERGG